MTKLNKIKSLEDFKEYNIICTTTKEVKECLEILNTKENNSEFNVYSNERIVYYHNFIKSYTADTIAILKKDISFYHFKKIYKRLKKQQEQEEQQLPDFETENGRVIKINNYDSDKKIYILDFRDIKEDIECCINDYKKEYLDMYINTGLIFSSKEVLNDYIKYLTIHTKLKNLANILNNGEKIDWNNEIQCKYYLFFDYKYKKIEQTWINWIIKGKICCLDKNFKDEAIKEISKKDLEWYLKQSY